MRTTHTVRDAAAAIAAARALVAQAGRSAPAPALEDAGSDAGALIGRCLERIASHRSPAPPPVRTLHHFACTGGTLFAKCLSSMPNVRLLSEVDPLSDLGFDPERPAFAPTDLVTLLKQSTDGRDPALIARLFERQVAVLHDDAVRAGRHLVIRDHAHSHYCTGDAIPDRPTLRELLPADVGVRSIVTVREPVDSFASLRGNGWVGFAPGDFETYCERYHRFLDDCAGVPIVRYEDFVTEPGRWMRTITGHLELPFFEGFGDVFAHFRITGDSGRTGDVIGPRPRQPEARRLAERHADLPVHAALRARMGYT